MVAVMRRLWRTFNQVKNINYITKYFYTYGAIPDKNSFGGQALIWILETERQRFCKIDMEQHKSDMTKFLTVRLIAGQLSRQKMFSNLCHF